MMWEVKSLPHKVLPEVKSLPRKVLPERTHQTCSGCHAVHLGRREWRYLQGKPHCQACYDKRFKSSVSVPMDIDPVMERKECPICCDTVDACLFLNCIHPEAHQVCAHCVERQLQTMRIVPRQPLCFVSETCRAPIQRLDLLSAKTLTRLNDSLLSGREQQIQCKACQGYLSIPTGSIQSFLTCPHCTRTLCFKCRHSIHPGELCPELEAKSKAEQESLLRAGAQQCPTCREMGIRAEACSKLKCKGCKTYFCDWCASNLNDHSAAEHHFCRSQLKESPASLQDCSTDCKHCPQWEVKTEEAYLQWRNDQKLPAGKRSDRPRRPIPPDVLRAILQEVALRMIQQNRNRAYLMRAIQQPPPEDNESDEDLEDEPEDEPDQKMDDETLARQLQEEEYNQRAPKRRGRRISPTVQFDWDRLTPEELQFNFSR